MAKKARNCLIPEVEDGEADTRASKAGGTREVEKGIYSILY